MNRHTTIYLDTNLWNCLADQNIAPRDLVPALRHRNTRLVISTHVIYEVTKTFRSARQTAEKRGMELSAYLARCLDAGLACAKDNMEILAAEMWALQLRTQEVNAFLSGKDLALVRKELGRLSKGDVTKHAKTFISERSAMAERTRLEQAQHLQNHSQTKELLKRIPDGKVKSWLHGQLQAPVAVRLLTDHIMRRFPEATNAEAAEYATALLKTSTGRIAAGLVRADLYYNWRCAHREFNPRDLIDDIYHVLNSTYCDVYATAEQKQSEYAALLVTGGTAIAIHDGKSALDRWLLDLT